MNGLSHKHSKNVTLSQSGFTLIELIITIVIFAIIAVVVGRVLVSSYSVFLISQNIAESDMQNLLPMERFINDAHTVRSSGDISTMTATQFSFTNLSGAAVSYTLSGSNLLRNGLTLATGVQSFNLAYYDRNGIATATPNTLQYITIAITNQQGNIQSSLTSGAGLRLDT